MHRSHRWILVGTLAAFCSCDSAPAKPIEPAPAKPIEPAPAKPIEPPLAPPTTPPDTSPTTRPTPAPAPSEFDALLVRLSGLPNPAAAHEPPLDEVGKTAWAHYKGKRYTEAAGQFARVAARDPAWKHAHNIACALAQAGEPSDTRIALAESIRRGGEAAKASANKDRDLAAVRELDWFATLLRDEPSPPVVIAPDAPVNRGEDEGEDEDDLRPANCPPDVDPASMHYCFFDAVAPFSFAPVVFDKPITLDLTIPSRPANQRWKTASGKIPWTELRAELGIQHTTESYALTQQPQIMFMTLDDVDSPLDDGADSKPFFWWPEDGTALLVIPHRQKLGKMRFNGVILARQTDAGWRAINLEVVTAKQEGWGGAAVLESGLGFRFDGLELFTLSQITTDGDSATAMERQLCRIRWEQGALARACVATWTDIAP